MIADTEILALLRVPLQAKPLLPEYSGIYYVLDEDNIIWYIGKAKNIRKRWQGKAHHRIYQLETQRNKHFTIYYESVVESQLDILEKQRIQKYQPHLNSSPVKTKKVRPVETLLRETIAAISDFSFVLGVEPPRQEIQSKIRMEWLIKKKVLGLNIIHICLDADVLRERFKQPSMEEQEALIKVAFNSRKRYASKWESFPRYHPFMYRLYTYGYAIEVNFWNHWSPKNEPDGIREYIETSLAQESIRALIPDSLAKIQALADESQQPTLHLKRLKPYNTGLISVLFKETIDSDISKAQLNKISEEYKAGMRGLGSRSRPVKSKLITSDFTTIDELLLSRGINPEKYSRNEIMGYDRAGKRMGVFIKCFHVDLKKTYQNIGNTAFGILNHKTASSSPRQFEEVYFLSSVDCKCWLLVEEYLKGFAKPAFNKLSNGVGFVKKFYTSPRKYVAPAKVHIKLESIGYSGWVPFGPSEEFSTFELATEEIRKRLTDSGLPGLKVGFKCETITK